MDDRRFDTLTRFLARPSRRSVFTAAGSVALAALLGWDTEIAAKPKKRKKRRKKKKPCTQNCVGKVCGETNGCGGSCTACPQGQSCVNKQCVDDTCTPDCAGKNCGAGNGCGGLCTTQQGCGANQTCVGGVCVTETCNPPSLICQGRCTDPLSDRQHCSAVPGDCGFACPNSSDWDCCDGTCAFLKGCLNGSRMSDCQKQYCGTCDSSCLGEGAACCEGSCVASDEVNCVFCGNSCTEELPTCCGGGIFGEGCTDPDRDPFNCGECGNVCDGGEACCHGECTPLGTPDNCTGCDAECEPGEICVSSGVGCAKP